MADPILAGQLHPNTPVIIAGSPGSNPAPVTPTPFYNTPEGRKDAATLAGVGLDVLNFFSPHVPPGLFTLIGLALRAIINLTTGGRP